MSSPTADPQGGLAPVARRRFGATGATLSILTLGTMRLPAAASDDDLERLLLSLVDAGVTSFHSSSEYDTFGRFCDLLGRVRAWRPATRLEHVIKLAEPHFGSDRFEPAAFAGKLDDYRRALGADTLDVVQWMLRFDLAQETQRVAILCRDSRAIGDAVAAARERGALAAMACFPYTAGFADAVLAASWCDGLVDYLGPLEVGAAAHLRSPAMTGRGFVALRPLAAGRVVARLRELAPANIAAGVAEALRLPLRSPATASIVVSMGSLDHARSAIAAMADVTASPEELAAALARTEDWRAAPAPG